MMKGMRKNLKSILEKTSEKIKNFQGKNFNEIADEAKDYARRKPGQAILISAAAGLVLGFLLRNGRRLF